MSDTPKYKLNKLDVLKGLLLAAISSVLFTLQDSIDAGALIFEWKKIGMAAVGGMAAYLIKNFFEGKTKTPN